jgi:hypothetical protein
VIAEIRDEDTSRAVALGGLGAHELSRKRALLANRELEHAALIEHVYAVVARLRHVQQAVLADLHELGLGILALVDPELREAHLQRVVAGVLVDLAGQVVRHEDRAVRGDRDSFRLPQSALIVIGATERAEILAVGREHLDIGVERVRDVEVAGGGDRKVFDVSELAGPCALRSEGERELVANIHAPILRDFVAPSE